MGIRFQLDHFDASFTEQELLEVIDQYNQNDDFHEFLSSCLFRIIFPNKR